MEPWRRTVYICLFGAFLASTGISQLAPILPIYLHELGMESSKDIAVWSGWAMGITHVVVALSAPFWGKLADRKGRKIILLRAGFGMMICNILIGFVTSPIQLVGVRLLQGLVSGYFSGSITLVATETPEKHTGWALGLLASANLAGALLGPLIGGYLAGIFGIRSTFFITAALLYVSTLMTLFFIHENFTPQPTVEKQGFSELRHKLDSFEQLVIISVSSFIYAVAFMSLQPIITVYVRDIVPPATEHLALLAGLVFSATGFAQMMSSSFLGRLIDRVGPRKVLIIALLYVGILHIPQAYVTNVWQLGLLRFLLGLGLGGLLPALNTYISSHTPKQYSGQVFSYNQSMQFFGYFLGSIGGASLMAWFGFTFLFWATGILFMLNALWVFLRIRP